MLEECRTGNIDLVVTKSLSSFSRDIISVFEKSDALKECGVGVYFYTENLYSLWG